jgi:general secretion pathway protein D
LRSLVIIASVLALSFTAQASSVAEKNAKAARLAYKRAIDYEQKHDLAGALAGLQEAAQLEPSSVLYQTALAQVRELLVDEYLKKGEQALKQNRPYEATAELKSALALDPTNPNATDDLRSLVPAPSASEKALKEVEDSTEMELEPNPLSTSFKFSGDTRSVLTSIAQAYGLEPDFDDNFPSRALTLQMENATLAQALNAATRMGAAMWVAQSPKQVFFAADTPEKHREFDRQIFRTFYLSDLSTPQELNEIATTLRTIFNLRYVVVNGAEDAVLARGPQPAMDAATEFLGNLSLAKPQVLLDIHAYEISGQLLRNLGIQMPLQYNIINIPPSVVAAISNSNVQNQINQLLAGNNTAQNAQALQALLAQLQQQSSGLSTLLNTPFVTFGGGQTFFAVAIPPVNFNFTWNQSYIHDLKDATLRTSSGDTASLLIGTRYPVLTSTYSISALTGAGLQTSNGAASFTTLPSFQYEDLGITLKAKPQINIAPVVDGISKDTTDDVTLGLNLAIRALGGSAINGVPVINNREYDGSIRLKDGESALLAGMVTLTRERSRTGIPFVSYIPVLGDIFSTDTANNSDDEILFIITPHVLRDPNQVASNTIWLPNSE